GTATSQTIVDRRLIRIPIDVVSRIKRHWQGCQRDEQAGEECYDARREGRSLGPCHEGMECLGKSRIAKNQKTDATRGAARVNRRKVVIRRSKQENCLIGKKIPSERKET